MKFIIPNVCPPDTFVDNVSHTLRAMGHEVLTMSQVSNAYMASPYRRAWKMIEKKINPSFKSPQEKWLLKTHGTFQPDVVLTLTQSLSEETLDVLKKNKIKTVAWWGDTPANMKEFGLLCKGWDLIFMKDPNGIKKLKRLELNAHLLHEAMNPHWHKPLSDQKNNNIIIAGSFYGYRNLLASKLLDNKVDLELYGNRPPVWADPRAKKMHTGQFVVKEEKSRVFGAGLACLNSTAMSEGNSMNCRAFEIAGTGGLHIMENRPILPDCFEPNKEVLVFDTFPELLELIEQAKKEPQKMKQIRQAGLKRALAEHTYQHRLEKIITLIQQL